MDILLLYLFTRLDAIGTMLGIVAFVAAVIALFCHIDASDDGIVASPMGRRLTVIAIVFAILCVLVPSQKDAALIIASYGVIEVAKSDTAQRLAGKSVQLIEQTLDGYLKKEGK